MRLHNHDRIGYVVKRYPRYSETFIVNEILAHEKAGLDIEIFALHPSSDSHFQDIISRVRAPVTFLPDGLQKSNDFWLALQDAAAVCPGIAYRLGQLLDHDPRLVAQAAALAAQVCERGITHLHAHFATSATTVARLAARFADVGFTFTAHAKDIFHESVNYAELAQKCADARAVVTVSDFNQAFLGHSFPSAAGKIHRIYNGLDLEQFAFASPADRPPTIISVGRLVEKKGFSELINACDILRRHDVDFTCQIIGSGELEDELRALITQLRLGDRVALLGPRPQREVASMVQSAAVFAAPCVVGEDGNRDGLPTVLLEAMALGTPCIGTDVTGIPEALISERTGICIAQRDTDALAGQLARLLHDSELRVRLATAARGHIERLFDVHRNAAAVRTHFSWRGNESTRMRTA